MMTSIMDLVMIVLTIISSQMIFFTAFSLEVPTLILVILLVYGCWMYYLFKVGNTKIKLFVFILHVLIYIILSSKLINGTAFLATTVFNAYKVADRTFNVPYFNYVESIQDFKIAILLINLPIVAGISSYYKNHKHLLLHYLPVLLWIWIPILYQYFPPAIYLILFTAVILTNYLTRYIKDLPLVHLGILCILIIIPSVLSLGYTNQKYDPPFHFEDLRIKINQAGKELQTSEHKKIKNLNEVGPLNPTEQVEYLVEGDYLGSYKLYGQVYSTYEGNRWIAETGELEDEIKATSLRVLNLHQEHNPNSIKVYSLLHVLTDLYRPYYVTFGERGSYTFVTYEDIYHNDYDDLNPVHQKTLESYSQYNSELYGSVPESLYRPLDLALEEADVNQEDDVYTKVEKVRSYLTSHFTYNLSTECVPVGEDFVAHFLETKEGYCVHFATTATLMLRRAGIMCRYVEGYQLTTYKDQEYNARNKDQHAWVEYFDPHVGWLPYEMTTVYSIENTLASYEKVTYIPVEKEEEKEDEFENDLPIHQEENQQEEHTNNNEVVNNQTKSSYTYLIPLVIILLIGFIRLIRKLRFIHYAKVSTNQYICFLYHQLDRIHVKVDQKHYVLALKAMYSNEIIDEITCRDFENYYISMVKQVSKWYITYYYEIRGMKK